MVRRAFVVFVTRERTGSIDSFIWLFAPFGSRSRGWDNVS